MIPVASVYLFHDEERNSSRLEDPDLGHEYLVDGRICREQMMDCDEVWIFKNRDPDDLMIMVNSMADEMAMEIQTFGEDEICRLIMG